VKKATVADGNLVLEYQFQPPKSEDGNMIKNCLRVFVPKGNYATVAFVENGTPVCTLKLKDGQWCVPEEAK
jgi:hypothetical protein